MIRPTHRRCRHEAEGLADAARRQTERADGLADDLRAAEHQADEIRAACEDVEYAREDAAIPEVLRQRLLDADDHQDALARIEELAEQRDRLLEAAHDAGTLVRTYTLLQCTGPAGPLPATVDAALTQSVIVYWKDSPWQCRLHGHRNLYLVWHPAARHRARLTCPCGRIWAAPPDAVSHGEAAAPWGHPIDGAYTTRPPWSSLPAHVLEAMDRALPTPAEIRQAAVPAPVPV